MGSNIRLFPRRGCRRPNEGRVGTATTARRYHNRLSINQCVCNGEYMFVFTALLALCIDCTDLLVGNWQLYYVYGTDAVHAKFAYETDWEKSIHQLLFDGTVSVPMVRAIPTKSWTLAGLNGWNQGFDRKKWVMV